MSALGVYVRSHEPLGGTAPYLTRPLVIAESADEAYGVGSEFGILIQSDLRFSRLDDGLFVIAFDYFSGSRIVIGQSCAAWVAHYGRPLVLRAYALVHNARRAQDSRCNFWGGLHSSDMSYERVARLANVERAGVREVERRQELAAYIASTNTFAVRDLINCAREHAKAYLPAPLRKRRARTV